LFLDSFVDMTVMIDINLSIIAFAGSLVILAVTERIMNTVLLLFLSFISRAKNLAAKQVMVSQSNAFATILAQSVNICFSVFFYLVSWWILVFIVFMFFSIVYVTFEETPNIWLLLISIYNTVWGPYIGQAIIIPFEILNLLVMGALPLWNSQVWFWHVLLVQGLLPLVWSQAANVVLWAESIFLFFKALVLSIVGYVEGYQCVGMACLVQNSQVFNAVTPLGYVKEVVSHTLVLSKAFCSYMGVPLDILAYPLIDMNLALFFHNFINAVLYLLFGLPYTTSVRCSLALQDSFQLMMCTPDFNPFFAYLVAASNSLGLVFDNWLNIVLVIVQAALTGSSPSCSQVGQVLISDLMANDDIFPKGSLTTVIGLSSWMYAVTDGSRAIFKGQSGSSSKVANWPFKVQVSHGVAAVSYNQLTSVESSVLSDGSTSRALQTNDLFGCTCDDTDSGVQISCVILPFDGWSLATQGTFKTMVMFPDAFSAKSMQCNLIDIHVRSVRFTFYRYSTADVNYGSGTTSLPANDCITKGDCREADASVWVIPRCGQDGAAGYVMEACIPGASCFPYCMGLRLSGSKQNNILMSSASQWKQGKVLLNRDCGLYSSSPNTVTSISQLQASFVSRSGNIAGTNVSASVYAGYSGTGAPECYSVPNVISRLKDPLFSLTSYNTYSDSQPFVVAGDVLFTAKSLGSGSYSVVVDRLQSNDRGSFSMTAFNKEFPAEPPPNVPIDETLYVNQDRVLIPYGTRIGPAVSTSSHNYVFYASNPDYGVFSAYFDYCTRDPNKMPKFGLIIKTSYGPLRVYRVNAFARCTASSCAAGLVRSIDFDQFRQVYDSKCDQSFNVSITQLEYLNEDNIAVVVQSSPIKSYDSDTNKFLNQTSTVYWLNPSTMQVSSSIWQTSVAISNYGTLCPGMQRMPRVGSFAAELVDAGIYLVEYMVKIPVYFPGMGPIWLAGGKCPQQTFGHSMLASCGADILSLENMFDSLVDAGSIFWHSLDCISDFMVAAGLPDVNPISNVLRGMAQFGDGSIDVYALNNAFLSLYNIPIKEQMSMLVASLESGSIVQAFATLTANMIMWVRFYYKVGSDLVLLVIIMGIQNNNMVANDIWQKFWDTLYNSMDYYESTVVVANQKTCSGLQTMMGVDNPWAIFFYRGCVAQTVLMDTLIQTLVDITVYIPMSVCICKESMGNNVATYAVNRCAGSIPVQLRPEMYMIGSKMQSDYSASTTFCGSVLGYYQNKLIHSMDPWFTNLNLALLAFVDCIDYMLIAFDSNAGKCLDFNGDPHVISIIPQPMDYFQACGKTSLCKTKCSAEWELFQEYKQQPVEMASVNFDYESLFFAGEYDSTLTLQNASAIIEITSEYSSKNERYCNVHQGGAADYKLIIAEVSGAVVSVRVWCIPQSASSSVYISTVVPFASLTYTVQGSVMQSCFVSEFLLCFLVQVNSQNQVVLIDAVKGMLTVPPLIVNQYELLINVMNIWPLMETVMIDVVMRTYENSDSAYVPLSYMNHYYLNLASNTWVQQVKLDMSTFSPNYMVTRVPFEGTDDIKYYKHLLIPQQNFMPAYMLLISLNSYMSLEEATLTSLATFDPSDNMASLPGNVISPHATTGPYVFAASRSGWDWLKQIRFNLNYEGIDKVKNSVSVPMQLTPQGNCNEQSCEGCPSVLVQRLCQAYNKCALVRCVGTLVNQMRPLCGVGQVLTVKGSEYLVLYQSGWTLIAQMIALSLKLGLDPGTSLDITWIDDAFMGYMCNAKDYSVEFWSIFTSLMDALMHRVNTNPAHSFRGSGSIDRNVDAALTIRSTTLNAFLAHITMLPFYMMIAMKQIYMCQVNGLLALLDVTGFKLRIQSADLINATNSAVGGCLSVSKGVMLQSIFTANTDQGVAVGVSSYIANALQLLTYQSIDPFIHILDAYITYYMGIVHTMAVMIMALFPANCNPPDYFMQDTVNCACNDYRLSIPAARAAEGIDKYPLWCTGTLGMVDNSNNQVVIVNPYTYAELQAKASDMQSYVDCISRNYVCDGMFDEVFERQGVTMANVMMKCRENFLKQQWDPWAFVYFDVKTQHLVQNYARVLYPPVGPIADCLLLSSQESVGPSACQAQYIGSLNLHSSDEYWSYEIATRDGPQYTDSCLVFSGPANVQNIPAFQACVDDHNNTNNANCSLSAQIWDTGSENDIPVAEPHIIQYSGSDRLSLVYKYYNDAKNLVLGAVRSALDVWGNESNPAVQVDFFSTEGDAVHQILDCIFMGPYSRVNYWPIPETDAYGEDLRGPAWYRDSDGGKTRGIDINTCDGGPTMPFSCGSEGRRSVIKYFVKNMLSGQRKGNNNKTLIQKVIMAELYAIYNHWANISQYSCECTNGSNVSGTYSVECCDSNNMSTWLPSVLQYEYHDIHSQNVLDALESEYENLYNLSIQDPLPWIQYNTEWQTTYDWNNKTQAYDEGLHDPTKPQYDYTSNMLKVDPAGAGLWGLCHAALKQVFFTLPVKDGMITTYDKLSLYDGDPAHIEQTIRDMVHDAMEKSPLFRHYYPVYRPSESLLCAQNSSSTPTASQAFYDNFDQNGFTLLRGNEVLDDPLPIWDYRALSIGNKTCACGWSLLKSGYCVLPPELDTCTIVCASVPCVACTYRHDLYDSQIYTLIDINAIRCPMYELSPHWGFLDKETSDKWVSSTPASFTLSTRDLLKSGRSGVKLGNIKDIYANSVNYVNEQAREIPLEHGVLHECPSNPDAQTLASNLFPVVHGVEEGGVSAFCLRYFIERARFYVMDYLHNQTANFTQPYLEQQERMYSWGKKCGSQLYLLHLCVSLDVFKPAISDNVAQQQCEYLKIKNEPNFYTTPECLVYLQGEFYDPCRCMDCVSGSVIEPDPTYLQAHPECKLRFNPIKKATNINAPIGLWEGQSVAYLDYLNITLLQSLLDDPDAVGNVQYTTTTSGSWANAEGFMQTNADFCDMMVDYWPDSLYFPVGYHVSTTCDAEDTAYRSFMNAFTDDVLYDPVTQEPTRVLKYQNDIMRDINDIDQLYGAGGLCRQNNFGMNMLQLNTMVYCTRSMKDETVDYTIPGFSSNSGQYSVEHCGSSSTDLPWDSYIYTQSKYSAAGVSLGTVPHMPSANARFYPQTLSSDDLYNVASDAITSTEWSSTCGDYPLKYCTGADPCPSLYTCRGMRCTNTENFLQCKDDSDCVSVSGTCQGVCLDMSVDCLAHSDCPDDKMCTGVGKCVVPEIIVLNQHEQTTMNIQFSVNDTESVSDIGDNYTLLGASYWGYMGQDLLDLHGMCSYGNWYKYTHSYLKQCQSIDTVNNVCWLDPSKTKYVDLTLPPLNSSNQNYWWDPINANKPFVMYVRATNCDRDYERLEGFTLVRPRLSDVNFVQLGLQYTQKDLNNQRQYYANYTRAYSAGNQSAHAIPIAILNGSLQMSPQSFVLGATLDGYIGPPNDTPFTGCSSLRQCVAPPFTVNFTSTVRRIKSTGYLYNLGDNFICGAIGYVSGNNECVIDNGIFPLYDLFCTGNYQFPVCSQQNLADNVRADVCARITNPYPAVYANIKANVEGLTELFYMFSTQIANTEDVMYITDCAMEIYTHMQQHSLSLSLYYPFDFVVKEFPFDYFYQCVLLTYNFKIFNNLYTDQNCVAYNSKDAFMLKNNPMPTGTFATHLRYVRGGITRSAYAQFVNNMTTLGMTSIYSIISEILREYPDGQDQSKPICSKYRRWVSNLLPSKKMLIEEYFSESNCKGNRISQLISIINSKYQNTKFVNEYDYREAVSLLGFVNSNDMNVNTKTISVNYTLSNWGVLLSETHMDQNSSNWMQLQVPINNRTLISQVVYDIVSRWNISERNEIASLQYNFQILDINSITITPDDDLLIQPSQISDVITSELNGQVEVKCAFERDRDPFIIDINTCIINAEDGLRYCDGKRCRTIPVYSHLGRFYCHYHYIDKVLKSNAINFANTQSVYAIIYQFIKSKFVLNINNNQNFLSIQPLSFFQDTDWQMNWKFNLKKELDYISNNQPDTSKTVMCTITNQVIDYNQCNHPHWNKLKQHTEKYYLHQGGILVNPGIQLQWKVNKKFMTRGFMTWYSSMNHSDPALEDYTQRLFGENSACKSSTSEGSSDWQEKVCYRYIDKSLREQKGVVNPWLHGYYNPFSRCDVSYSGITPDSNEYIDTYMYPGADGINYPPDMPFGETCAKQRKQTVLTPGPTRFSTDPATPDEDFPYNLCHHVINDGGTCVNDQGLVGNDDGLPVGSPSVVYNPLYDTQYTDEYNQYKVASDMYSQSSWSIPNDYKTGLFSGSNLLWQGSPAPLGYLQIPVNELGVHRIAFLVIPPNTTGNADTTYSSYVIYKLPLTTLATEEKKFVTEHSGKPVSEWVSLLQNNIADDDTRIKTLLKNQEYEKNADYFDVSCPIKRFAYYGRNSTFFHAITPSPERTKYMFGHLNGDSYGHPTMQQSYDGAIFGSYHTVNGFCFCPYVDGIMQTQCQMPIQVSSSCSLDATIDTLKAIDGVWFDSYVFPVVDVNNRQKPCKMQVDWPIINNPLRDGMVDNSYENLWRSTSGSETKACHILDRFAPFKYRYKNTKEVRATSKNTVRESGVCATGRVSDSDNVLVNVGVRCSMTSRSSVSSTHTCENSQNTLIALNRKLQKNEQVMFKKYKITKRSKCSKCSKPPLFVNAENNPIPPESSFGQTFRLSVAKTLKADLLSVFASSSASNLINAGIWNSASFLTTYLKTPHLLFTTSSELTPMPLVSVINDTSLDDRQKWKKPWVYCPTVDSFRTQNCKGVIERDAWIKNKVRMCPTMIKSFMQESNQDPMSHASFANIDQHTNKVVQAIVEARALILQANCIASGQTFCMPRPFVYQPALYDTTNRAWVHDTVVQYYKGVNPLACPATDADRSLISYLQSKQLKCPANNLYILKGLLQILRVFCTEIAILMGSLISILIKLLAAPFSSSAKSQLRSSWADFKKQFKEMMSNISDLFVNMLMNSGELGSKLILFIQTMCNYLNKALEWFTMIWCEYIQKYLIQFMSLIQKFSGWTEGFARAIQEFLNFLFRYYLPASFIKKYLSSAMQGAMLNKYDKPTSNSEREKNKNAKVQNAKPTSRIASAKQSFSKSIKSAGSAGISAAKGGAKGFAYTALFMAAVEGTSMLVSMAMGDENDGIQGIIDGMWISKEFDFDFGWLRDAADNVVYFFTNDDRCTSYMYYKEMTNHSYIIQCPAFDLDPLGSTNPAESIDATLCWASINPSLGMSSMYSCTASSTCCPASGCTGSKSDNVLCNDCPYASAGVSQFACDNMVCRCSVPVQVTSYCIANSGCSENNAYCDLVSMMSSVSFGTMPCSLCPGKLMCVAGGSGTRGRCSCIMDKTVNMATCYESYGTKTYPNPQNLCGYMPRLSSSSSQSTFQYSSLMGVLCSKSLNTICANVYMDNGYAVSMPVAYSIRPASTSFWGSRRLLTSDNKVDDVPFPDIYTYENDYDTLNDEYIHQIMHWPLWNISSAPCSSLAYAYQRGEALSILEEHEIKKCAYWRHVGRKIITEFNFTSLKHLETFLISIDDFSLALTQKNVLWDFIFKPHVLGYILLMHPYLKPVRAIFIALANLAEEVATYMRSQRDHNGTVHDLSSESAFMAMLRQIHENEMQDHPNISQYRQAVRRNYTSIPIGHVIRRSVNISAVPRGDNNKTTRNGRHLLASTSEMQAIQQYSASIIQGASNPALSFQAVQSWLRGPYAWPPRYIYSYSTCPAAQITVDALIQIFTVSKAYYENFDKPLPVVSRALKDNLPSFYFYDTTINTTTQAKTTSQTRPWSWLYHKFNGLVGINENNIKYFFVGRQPWSLLWILQTSLKCDFAGVMTCKNRTKDLFMSIIVFVIAYIVLYYVCSALGISSVSSMFLLSFPAFILWYTYGMSMSCLPMFPTCILTDIVDFLKRLFPLSLSLPVKLYCNADDVLKYRNATDFTSSCVRSCEAIGFTDWYDPLTYTVCSYDFVFCGKIVNGLGNVSYVASLHLSFSKWHNVYTYDQANLDAYSFCTLIQWVNTLPFIIGVLVFATVFSAVVYALLAMVPAGINMIAQVIAYNHVD
jgi:hypothetical protein